MGTAGAACLELTPCPRSRRLRGLHHGRRTRLTERRVTPDRRARMVNAGATATTTWAYMAELQRGYTGPDHEKRRDHDPARRRRGHRPAASAARRARPASPAAPGQAAHTAGPAGARPGHRPRAPSAAPALGLCPVRMPAMCISAMSPWSPWPMSPWGPSTCIAPMSPWSPCSSPRGDRRDQALGHRRRCDAARPGSRPRLPAPAGTRGPRAAPGPPPVPRRLAGTGSSGPGARARLPARYPRGQAGMTHRDGQSMRRPTRSIHILPPDSARQP
jgi:hypothetical protein